jgi:hypothetical protein
MRLRLPQPVSEGKGGESLRKLAISAGLLFVLGSLFVPLSMSQAPAAAATTSGFAVGARTPPFDVIDVTGPFKSKVCYI